tara:strand:+ start:395 stop:1657 length:1263 start_codon:yes stop_codon:yes gene_type:complete
MNILLEAPILTQSGYGEHSKHVFRSLNTFTDHTIFINPLNWGTTGWNTSPSNENSQIEQCVMNYSRASSIEGFKFDAQIHVGLANEFEKKAPFSVLVTAGVETDRVSPQWLIQTHKGIDQMVVTSEHTKSSFENSSYEISNEGNGTKTTLECNCPVKAVPYPIKDFDNVELDLKLETKFNFLSIALMGARKNQENLVRWFVEHFHDNPEVGLILKTGVSAGSIIDRNRTTIGLEHLLASYKDRLCKVYLLHGDLSESEIHSLYTRDDIHAYVTTTHAEGFGLPIFEAAYSGLPIIATDWSAHTEFLSAPSQDSERGKITNKKLFANVDYDLAPVQPEAVWEGIIIEGSQWAYPREESFKEKLQDVYENHKMYKTWAQTLKDHICKTHNKKDVMLAMVESLGFENNIKKMRVEKEEVSIYE